MIQVQHVNKFFNKNKRSEIHVLNDITLTFPSQGLVVLSGHSGSGKTTLLNVLGGLDDIQKGTISLDQTSIKKYNTKVWDKVRRNNIGYIFQNYYLIPSLTVFDNIAVSLRLIGMSDEEAITDRVHYILHQVGMYKFRKRHAHQLSGGQQQRVAIARALVKTPDVIIADEPTGNLDSKNTVEIMNIIKKISEHRLVILVTHERELAEFYGDRIIEIEDGVIIDDKINEPSETYELEHTDDIYLRDFTNTKTIENIQFYNSDTHMDLQEDVDVKLIYKNGTLYLDVSGVPKKVRLVSPDSGINVHDAHFVKEKKEDIMKTDFELDSLQHEGLTSNRDMLFTWKENLKSAFLKIMTMTKKQRLMLIGFFFTGVVTAFAASILGQTLFSADVDAEELKGYVSFNKQSYLLDFDTMYDLGEGDDSFFINVYKNEHLNITIPSSRSYNRSFDLKGELDIIDHVDDSQLVYGRMPDNHYEFVVDLLIFTKANGPYDILAKYGIWSVDQLIGEEVHIKDNVFTIVGVVDSGARRFYGTRSGISLLSYDNKSVNANFLALDLVAEDLVVIDGELPEPGSKEVLVPSSWVGKFVPAWAFDVEEYDYRGHLVAGSYDDDLLDLGYTPYIGHVIDVEYYIFRNTVNEMNIYSSDPEQLLQDMQELDMVATWEYGTAKAELENTMDRLLTILYISIFIILFAGLGVYYMMRSSMLARIYNISVFRALGVRKASIRRGFMLEVVLITSMSTLVGYVVTSGLILQMQNGSYLRDIAYLNLSSFGLGILLIYGINVLFGVLSIEGQLQKTPAVLLSSYDM